RGRQSLERVDPQLAGAREVAAAHVVLALGEDRPDLVERGADPRGLAAARAVAGGLGDLDDDAVPRQADAGERGEARDPDLVVPGQRRRDPRRVLGRLLLGPLAEVRARRRVEALHLVVPATREAVAKAVDLERGDQR